MSLKQGSADSTPLATDLRQGAEQLKLSLAAHQVEKLISFIKLLEKWNRAYNLSAVRDPVQMVPLHLLDSLAVIPYLRGGCCVDVGSGAGLPGIPLAIYDPIGVFTLIEANAKKARFIRQVTLELKLSNIEIVQDRVEAFRPVQVFDVVLARAFASLADLIARAGHLCAGTGRVLAMKGRLPHPELAELEGSQHWRCLGVHALHVPGIHAQRHLVELARVPPA